MGDYAIEGLLGTGGFAFVYRARDPAGRLVAVKVPRPEANVKRFRMEAGLGRDLQHPGIVRCFRSGEHGGTPFIVMEYVAAPTLKQWRERVPRKCFDEAAVRRVGIDVAKALDFAFALPGVRAHRDVKPGNIFADFSRPEKPGPVKIGDFGIVKHVDSNLTGRLEIIGVAAYLAPEVGLGNEYSYASDMFSLGVVLYLMSCGTTPFPRGRAPLEVVARYIKEPIPPPSARGRPISRDLEAVIMRCLARRPEDRFASMAELAGTLNAVQPAAGRAVVVGGATGLTGESDDSAGEQLVGRVRQPPHGRVGDRTGAGATVFTWIKLILGVGFMAFGVICMLASLLFIDEPVLLALLAVTGFFCGLLGLAGIALGVIDFFRRDQADDGLIGLDLDKLGLELK